MNENNIINEELEMMRQQMAALKEKLDSQEIINSKLMRTAMKGKLSWIERYVRMQAFVLLPISIVVFPFLTMMFDLSWWWYAYAVVFLTADVVFDWYVHITKAPKFDGNLVDAARVLAWQKDMRTKQFAVSVPLLIIFIGWMAWGIATFTVVDSEILLGMKYGGLGGLAFGSVCGFVFGINILRKMQRTNNELIAQIEEITSRQ